eukprot:CAMPEP_0174368994 /NCGR_PEP_ID=MMETSP0811_2-20130205/90941_1 /TAXON_ID=73025 ORGANISM="Eutreptiella gymnastica-like, Strain CCMP1594" /NCGR_SAMPLE_ID=MMETSP0811_2 /ASSEMBLY_ACC=CAM_ASM_000667 /LENGTH=116 /DNA_ID=CAMNT_0015512993 /DNA_START=69 /DNA_END=416 /DNA_ORIENTATION=+
MGVSASVDDHNAGLPPPITKYSDNDYELVIHCTKQLERILRVKFAANFSGLVPMANRVDKRCPLPPELMADIRYVAFARNEVLHEYKRTKVKDREKFIVRYEAAEQGLRKVRQPKW